MNTQHLSSLTTVELLNLIERGATTCPYALALVEKLELEEDYLPIASVGMSQEELEAFQVAWNAGDLENVETLLDDLDKGEFEGSFIPPAKLKEAYDLVTGTLSEQFDGAAIMLEYLP